MKNHALRVFAVLLCAAASLPAFTQTTYSVTLCSGEALHYKYPGHTPGETYSWSLPVITPGGAASGSSSGVNQLEVFQTLTNTINTPVVADYTVTTSRNISFLLRITVNPAASIGNLFVPVCSGSLFSYTPTDVPANTRYTWVVSASSPAGVVTGAADQPSSQLFIGGQTLLNPSTAPATVTYTVSPKTGACAGNSFLVTTTVNPLPVLNNQGNSPAALCSGQRYTYSPASSTTGASIVWARNVVTGIDNSGGFGVGNPNELLNNSTVQPVVVNYRFTLSANSCSNTQDVAVTVNPSPVLSTPVTPVDICSGNAFNYTPQATLFNAPTFAWTISTTNAEVNGGAGNSGTASINDILINSNATNTRYIVYSIRTTDGVTGCQGSAQRITVGVNPLPRIANMSVTVCSGNTFFASPSNVPAATKYTWTTPAVTGSIAGASANGVPQFFVGQQLTNAGTTGTVSYAVTPWNNLCPGADFTVTVTVNAGSSVPLISNNAPAAICSGTKFNFHANSTATGPTYSWKRFNVTGISGALTSGTTDDPDEVLTMLVGYYSPITTYYSFTTKDVTGCENTQLIPVTVKPLPTLVQTAPVSAGEVCSNAVFTYTPQGTVANTSYTWSRIVTANISNAAGSGTGSISETLVNTSTAFVNVPYSYTLSANGCSNTQSLTVRVNAVPKMSVSLTAAAICSGSAVSYPPASATSGTIFEWQRSVVSSISNGSGSGVDNPAEILVNTSTATVTVPYVYKLTANGCSGTQTVTVSVKPSPMVGNLVVNTCSNTSFTVSPLNVPVGTTYSWLLPTYVPAGTINNASAGTNASVITQTLVNGSSAAATATYSVIPSAGGCTGSAFSLDANIAFVPQLTSAVTPAAICGSTLFSYDPLSNTSGTMFSWTRSALTGISNPVASGINNPNETLVNVSSSSVPVVYTYVLTTPAGCVNTQNVTVNVNALPVLTNPAPAAICSGLPFSFAPTSSTASTTYTWARQTMAAINNGTVASGTTNIAEVLVNSTTATIRTPYLYTLTANGCSNSQTVNVDVKPTPTITNQFTSTCNNTAFVVSPANVPLGTQYTWGQPLYTPTTAIANGTAQNIPQNTISQVLNNSTSAPAFAAYTVTPAANGCTGSPFIVAVTVNAATSLNTSLTPPAVCSNNVFNYTPDSNTPGTAFSWTRTVVTGISNSAASGTGNPAEALINITSNPVTVTYTYSLNTPNACQAVQQVNVVVNPAPVLTSDLNPAAICSGTQFLYTPASATTGTTYAWVRPVLPAISNGQGNGAGPINPAEVLVNTTINPVTVAYNYTLTANSCTNQQTVYAIVKPAPKVANLTVSICANTVFNINPLNVPAGTRYTWALPSANPSGTIGGISAQPVPQDNIGQTLTNSTVNTAFANYIITPQTNGCTGASFAATVSVTPAPSIPNQVLASVCSGTAFSYAAVAVPAGTSYTWGTPVLGPLNSLTGGSPETISQVAVSQTLKSTNNLTDTATYTVVPSASGCVGNSFTLVVPVKPTPVVANLRDTVCTGLAFTVIPSPVPINTLYTWTAPASVPAGIVTGGSARNIGAPTISQTLFNGSNAIAEIVYTVTPSTNGCTGTPFTLTETVGIPLAKVADRATVVCSEVTFEETPATTPPNTTYTWSTPTVAPVLSASGFSAGLSRQTRISQTLKNLTELMDTVTYSVVPFNTGCTGNPFKVAVYVRPVPRATVSGPTVVCRYPFDTLAVNFVGQGPWTFDYTDNGVTGTISNITTAAYKWVVNAIPTLESRTFTIMRSADNACIDSIHTSGLTQKINPLPVGQVVTKHGIYICEDKLDTLSIQSAETLSYQWTYNGSAVVPSLTTPAITTRSPGSYNAILTNQFGCIDTAAAPVALYYINKPLMQFSYDIYCVNMPIHFTNLVDTAGMGPTDWLWDFGDNRTASDFNGVNVYVKGGKHHVKLRASQLYCPASVNMADSTLDIQYPIAAVRLPSVSVYRGEPTQLTGRDSAGYRYQWLPTKGIDNPNTFNPNFNFEVTQDYVIQLISPAGCITPDSMLVRVFDPNLVNIMVPKSFTPNGDGVNDILYPYLSGIKTFHYFKVFNRLGQMVFETKNKDIGWNGTMGGVQQPMAIYIWVATGIALDGSPVEKKGQVLLLR
ncbi:gliding motility-associated C-terminal domain-containing protein [Sediminibacterium sp. WSJ-3]|nr:gliding motility-associated C-terminal domain-containing protein [Sediminibacterium soli]